jgi:hypothetical protein
VSYDNLHLIGPRDDALRVLKLNFPHSKYLKGVNVKEKAWYRFW